MNLLEKILSLIKSLTLSLKIFDFKTALKMPIYVKYDTKCIGMYRGCIQLEGKIRRGMISISTNRGTLLGDGTSPSVIRFKKGGTWKVKEKAWCSGSCVINVGGELKTKGFTANGGLKISCAKNIVLNEDALLGWNVTIIDSDGHDIVSEDIVVNKAKDVEIGSHVWLCANTTIMKGTKICDNSVVAMGSIVTKAFNEPNVIIVGNTIKRKNINWVH